MAFHNIIILKSIKMKNVTFIFNLYTGKRDEFYKILKQNFKTSPNLIENLILTHNVHNCI